MLPELNSARDLLYAWLHAGSTLPFFIKICFFISIGAVMGIFIITVSIALIKLIENQHNRKTALAKNHINRLLLSTVMSQAKLREADLPKSSLTIESFNKSDISSKTVKELLICEMFNYRNNFSGKVAENIRKLYIVLALQKEAIGRLYSRRWRVKVQALSELYQMDIAGDHTQLLQLLEDKNKYVRDHARLSLIKFTSDDPLKFLRNLNEPISQWEEFEIFELLRNKSDYELSSLAELIRDEKEHTVVSLCLKLVVHFKQMGTINVITGLIKTADMTLRAEAITSLGKMHSSASEPYLTEIYHEQPPLIKMAILEALGNIKSSKSLGFLETEFIAADDFQVKKSASDAIIKLYPDSSETIDRIMAIGNDLNKSILRHSLNPLINNK
jgi:hypothetical protein